ncbi:MAG TPA: maleylpyruvate isomerase N-terminal domain-containing protein [Actinomycetota bacterium]
MTDMQHLLREEDDAWRDLDRWFELVGDDRFEKPTLTPEGWSPKDAMFHISGWMDDCAVQLGRIRAGVFDPTEETREAVERQNQAWFEISRTMAPADIRAGFAASHQRMIEAFGALEDVTPEAVEWFEESGALHYAKHAEDLRVFAGGSGP